MRNCWLDNPHDRPTFEQLSKIFDDMRKSKSKAVSLKIYLFNTNHDFSFFSFKVYLEFDDHYKSINCLDHNDYLTFNNSQEQKKSPE